MVTFTPVTGPVSTTLFIDLHADLAVEGTEYFGLDFALVPEARPRVVSQVTPSQATVSILDINGECSPMACGAQLPADQCTHLPASLLMGAALYVHCTFAGGHWLSTEHSQPLYVCWALCMWSVCNSYVPCCTSGPAPGGVHCGCEQYTWSLCSLIVKL